MIFADKNHIYGKNQTIFKIYGIGIERKIKLVSMNVLRKSGFELAFEFEKDKEEKAKKGTKNSEKMRESIVRTKNHIFDLAYCNAWEYFFTGTLDSSKYSRECLEKFRKDLSVYIKNFNRNHSLNIKYLLVPELHSDKKSWHFHGFLMGLPKEYLKQFKLGDKMSKKLAERVKNGAIIYNWLNYQNKFGFCDLEPIRSKEGVSKYITKYINKELESSITELNAHKFYASKGLNTPKIIKVGTLNLNNVLNFYQQNVDQFVDKFFTDYCTTYWLNYSKELERIINANFFEQKKD